MRIVKICGGLGNQMFQYAFGKYLSENTNKEVYYDTTWFTLTDFKKKGVTPRLFDIGKFNVKIKVAEHLPLYRFLFLERDGFRSFWARVASKVLRYKYICEKSPFKYDSDLLKYNKSNVIFGNYFCSFKYSESIRDILLSEFIYKDELSSNSLSYLDKINNCESVSIHIRRGDYIKYSSEYHLCDDEYYKSAISIIKEKVNNPTFFIFSDDLEYCKSLFNGDEYVFVTGNEGERSIEDMILMSKCRNNIIANSTFSYWGAWLNTNEEKTVIAPTKWTKNEPPSNELDIYPNNWILI